MTNRVELKIWFAIATTASALVACESAPGNGLSTADAALDGERVMAGAGAKSAEAADAPLERLETVIEDGVIAIATSLENGDIEVELRDQNKGQLLARGWISRSGRTLQYTLLRQHQGAGRGEVLTIPFAREPSLENANLAIGELWRYGAAAEGSLGKGILAEDGGFVQFSPPGCHFATIPFEHPSSRNLCMQNCCAIFAEWNEIALCDYIPDASTPIGIRDMMSSSSWGGLPRSPCAVGSALFKSCIANCLILPPQESYGEHCTAGETQCFDERCSSTWRPWGTLYCREDCFTEESPCDIKPQGSQEFCNKDVLETHDCEDANGRRGYWAPDCTTTMSSCECKNLGLWRCSDDRCAEGRNGYCGDRIGKFDTPISILADDHECDMSDTRSPCCGAIGQICCEDQCEEGANCDSGMCVSCGKQDELPCKTPDGLKCNDRLDYRGAGTCTRCGPGLQCCINSTQYEDDDICSGLQDTSCVDDKCVQCGYQGQTCCADGITYNDTQYANISCIYRVPCTNGTCGFCGWEGEACCPGGSPWSKSNFCHQSSGPLECRSGTCRKPNPMPPPPAPAAWKFVLSTCGLLGQWVIQNVGGTSGDATITADWIGCTSFWNEGIQVGHCNDIAPGQNCFIGNVPDAVAFILYANGEPIGDGQCPCPSWCKCNR